MAFMKAALGWRAVFLAAGFLAAAFLAAIGFFPPWGSTSPLEIWRTLAESDRLRKGVSPLKVAFSPLTDRAKAQKIKRGGAKGGAHMPLHGEKGRWRGACPAATPAPAFPSRE